LASAQVLRGDIRERSGEYKEAAEHYARAVELDPSEDNVWLLGQEFLRHWTFDAAEREFEAAVVRFPQSTRMRLGLGAAYFGDAKYAKAVLVFADLLQADPDNSLYAEMLGQSCSVLVYEDKPRCSALLAFAQAHPSNAKAATYAAASLLENPSMESTSVGVTTSQDQLPIARRLLEVAIATDPKSAEAYYEMGVLQQLDSQWRESITPLEKAVALKPDFAKAHYRLGLAYWRAGRKPEGRAEIELEKKYHKQQQDDLNQRMSQITTFLVDVHN
jgi:tetratricopeptide (TPR) repeat protein